MSPDPGDPRTYDYSHPVGDCDIVMKGGITSGVVYPHAVCELARTYRFKSIGGTSAGAIAAAGAAAAEYGRESGGFEKLAKLPDWIGSRTHLFDLFQPHDSVRGLYATFTAGLGARGLKKWRRVAAAAVRSFPLALATGALPGLAVLAVVLLASGGGTLQVTALAAGVVLALLGAVLGIAARVVTLAPKAISGHGFGMCSGMPEGKRVAPALTPWLAALIDDLADKTDGSPLTFGDLRARGIELAMVTTNLTQRRPHVLPWDDRVYSFDPKEWRKLFPERVVRWMLEHPAGEPDEAMLPRRPLPAPDDLPVVVAARMSLSFPVLISAVPLWAFDHTRKQPVAERCWFSDGGISSNFPVHLFDSPLPTRPTFAIDLDAFHPDHPKTADERDNVYLPSSNVGGLLETWHRFPGKPGFGRFAAFAGSVVRTMQNRVDSELSRQPGYRDRIVHVHADESEGGMNLTMPPHVITALTRRGQEAARRLVQRFHETPESEAGLSWDNHRWVRYRAATAALAEQLAAFEQAWNRESSGERSYEELVRRDATDPPAGYRFVRAGQRDLALGITERLVECGELVRDSQEDLADQAPRPLPRARIVPRD